MQNEKLRQKGPDAHDRQQQRAESGRRRSEQQSRAAHLKNTGEITEPLAETDAFKHLDHSGQSGKLGASGKQKKRREHKLKRPESDRLEARNAKMGRDR